jgi:cytochrome P450
MMRQTTMEVAFGQQTIPAGALVSGWIGSANRDEAKFRDPDRFDIDRSPNPHVAFGRGSHYCLGASLARLEMTTVLTALVERVRSFARVPGMPLEPLPSPVIYGVRELHLRLVPA